MSKQKTTKELRSWSEWGEIQQVVKVRWIAVPWLGANPALLSAPGRVLLEKKDGKIGLCILYGRKGLFSAAIFLGEFVCVRILFFSQTASFT